jgi:hypothetical protein
MYKILDKKRVPRLTKWAVQNQQESYMYVPTFSCVRSSRYINNAWGQFFNNMSLPLVLKLAPRGELCPPRGEIWFLGGMSALSFTPMGELWTHSTLLPRNMEGRIHEVSSPLGGLNVHP